MKILIAILIIMCLASSCGPVPDNASQSTNKFDTLPLPHDTSIFYFRFKERPQDNTQDALDTFVNRWFSKMLFAMKEPVLNGYQGDKEIYRFTWLRTFHHPVAIRIEKQNNNIRLFGKICNGAGGYEPGRLIFDTAFNITAYQYESLTQKIDNIQFWNLTTKLDDEGKDGSEWIIEVVRNNKYHLVVRWTPTEYRERDFKVIGEYFLSLSNIGSKELQYSY